MSDASTGQERSAVDPLVSVGIFGYNHAKYIVASAESVLSSTFQDWELFIVDDGSDDATAQHVGRWVANVGDERVRFLADGDNKGLAVRLNEVVERARGQWLAVLGGDDQYLPRGLETLVAGISPDVDVVWGDLEVVDQMGLPKGYARPRDTWQGPTARRYTTPRAPGEDILRVNNFVSGTSPLVRLRALREVGGYTEGVANEDLDLWLRLGRGHLFRYVNAPVARYRIVPGSTSRSEHRAVLDQARMARRLAGQGLYPDAALARLVAMRWLLGIGRSRGRAPVRLSELCRMSGFSRRLLLRQAPRAGLDPLALSAVAYVRRLGGR